MPRSGRRPFAVEPWSAPNRAWLLATALVCVTGLCGVMGSGAAWAERSIADRVPIEDPSLSPRANPAPPPPPAPDTGSYLGSAAGTAMDALAWSAAGFATLPGAAGQFLWEVSYLLGINRTPVQPPRVAAVPDPVPQSLVRQPAAIPSQATRPVPALAAADPARAADPASAPSAASAPPSPVVTTVVAARPPVPPSPVMPIGPQDEVEPGLVANMVYDRSHRREDGTYFVPKPLQRLFNIRTERVRQIDVPTVLRIAGRIVPDPSLHGTVQPSVPGRLEPTESGFPSLGQTVKKGQIMALVTPSIGIVDLSQVRRDVTKLTNEIRLETEALEILRQFSWVPFREGKIYQAEQKVAGLRRERDALLPMLELREALRAPTDGVVSSTKAVNGKIVQPGEVVFDVIDPSRLWVEATAPDPATAETARGAPVAAAVTPEGTNLILRFVGTGLSAARQATPVLFSIDDPPPGLRVGRPVTVTIVNAATSQRGILLNRSAVTQGSSGLQEVWEQTAPETFVPHAVRTSVIDGTSILVTDGVPDGARIVINGSRLMAQLQ